MGPGGIFWITHRTDVTFLRGSCCMIPNTKYESPYQHPETLCHIRNFYSGRRKTMKLKKAVALSLAAIMTMSLGSAIPASADEEKAHLIMSFRTSGAVPSEENIKKVEQKLDELIADRINAEIELIILQSSSYKDQMTLMLSGYEQLDIMGAPASLIPSAVSGEQLRDLGDLLDEYGQGIREALGEELLNCGIFDGTQYCLPVNCDTTLGLGYYIMRKDICEKYDIDPDAITNYEELTEAFQKVHDGEPEMTVVAPGSAGYSFMQFSCTWDKLGNYFGVLDHWGQDDLTVVDLFETQSYRDYLDVMRDWYKRGFISADVTNATDSGSVQIKAGNLFAMANSNKPGMLAQEQMNTGIELVGAQVLPSISWTANNWQWCIPENAEHPEEAMQFLNLLYTDPDVINTIVYGLEGEDYVIHEDGRIGYPEGVDASNVGYSVASMLWSFGNEFNAYVWETNEPDVWEQTIAWNETGYRSKAFGFVFDPSPVQNEIAAVQNVYDQYRMSLECGLVDPETTLPEMVEKMKAAGLDTIIEEKQAQLDAWAEVTGAA